MTNYIQAVKSSILTNVQHETAAFSLSLLLSTKQEKLNFDNKGLKQYLRLEY